MSILYKNGDGNIVSLIPDMNNIDDTTVSASTTYSSSKIEQINTEYPISSTTSGINPTITDSADGYVQKLTVYGKSRVSENLVDYTKATNLASNIYQGNLTITATSARLCTPPIKVTTGDYISITYPEGFKLASLFILATNTIAEGDSFSEYTYKQTESGVGYYTYQAEATGYLYFYIVPVPSRDVSPSDISTFMAVKGQVPKSYEPYGIISIGDSGELDIATANSNNTASTTATVTTGVPLYSVGDVKDELDEKKGVVVKRCEKVVFDGSEDDWAIWGQGATSFSVSLANATKSYASTDIPIMVCNSFNVVSRSTIYLGGTDGVSISANTFFIHISSISTILDLKTYLASNPVTVVYELAEPYEIPLSVSEISSYHNLRTYNPTTNVTITDDPTVDVGYILNTENGQAVADVQNGLQGQIDDIKNAIKPRVYAFYIDQNDSNPATCVHPYYNTKYGCDNLLYQNAYMDYEKDEFNYGSWKEFIYEFFKPCMLAYDGHVDYYLDPDDYSKKFDGGDSDISDMTYNGNVMVQIKKLYFKRWTTDGKYYCIISDKKLDKSFKAYAHHDIKGNVLDYIYRAAYDGSYDGTRLRSISGIDYHNVNALTANKIMSNTTRQQEIDFAKANNDANEQGEGWNILHKAEWDMMRDLLLLIGMNTNTQATFGNGNIATYVSASNTGILPTGTMDKKGLFYGKNDNVSGVKVFGFEMPWGNIWKSCLGWNLINGVHYTKMTHGTEDGSAGTGFNISGTGYLPLDAAAPSGTNGGYVNTYTVGDNGYVPLIASGSATTYTCDGLWFNNGINAFALVGGSSDSGAPCGAFCAALNASAAAANWVVGAALSYKPLARG